MNADKILVLVAMCAFGADHVVVIAHRGEHQHHPENTLKAFQAAIDAGADFFELDVRTSADGKLVLMHDATVDRMTDGKGEIASMTFEAIRKLSVRGSNVPTFDEALELARGKIGIYVDCKKIAAADLISAIERARMSEHVLIYGGSGFLSEVAAMRPKLRVMPEAGGVEQARTLIEGLKLKVLAFDARDFLNPVIEAARKAGVEIYVDRLGSADNEAGWHDAIDRGANGIQTDHPAELVAYLKLKKYR
jgi:glycerophosphoryl diester phosphodiesterase